MDFKGFKSKSEMRRIEHMKECERNREFEEWIKTQVNCCTSCESAWKEARKGYVSLKKVEEMLQPCKYTGCEKFISKLIEEIKELGNE